VVSTGALAWTRGRALAGLAAGPASRLPVRRYQRVCPDVPTECSRATRVQVLGVEADQRGPPAGLPHSCAINIREGTNRTLIENYSRAPYPHSRLSRCGRGANVLLRPTVECWPIEDGHRTEKKLQALIKMEVACRLALESLPELPRETEQALRAPIEKLCELSGQALDRLQPGFAARDAEST